METFSKGIGLRANLRPKGSAIAMGLPIWREEKQPKTDKNAHIIIKILLVITAVLSAIIVAIVIFISVIASKGGLRLQLEKPIKVATTSTPALTTTEYMTTAEPLPEINTDKVLDIAVVGGGISGSYFAWNMRDTGQQVGLFEYSNRIGGRLWTCRLGEGNLVELGDVKYQPAEHPIMTNLVKKLGLESKFYQANIPEREILLFFRGVPRYLDMANTGNMPFFLESSDIVTDFHSFKNAIIPLWVDPKKQTSSDPMTWIAKDGQPYYTFGIQNILTRNATMEAMSMLRSAVPFQYLYSNNNAALHGLPADESVLPHDWFEYSTAPPDVRGQDRSGHQNYYPFQTITEGMQEIPLRMVREFSGKDHQVAFNSKLEKVAPAYGGVYNLTFRRTRTTNNVTIETGNFVTVQAKKVVLALPRRALEDLDLTELELPERWHNDIRSSSDIKFLMLYLLYDVSWWDRSPYEAKSFYSDLPIGNVLKYSRVSANRQFKNGTLLIYCDGTCIDYWRPLIDGPMVSYGVPTGYNVTSQMMGQVNRYLSTVMDVLVEKIPDPKAAALRVWDCDQAGCGLNLWKPGFNWTDVREHVTKPGDGDIYVTSSAFAPWFLPRWAEGGLNVTQYVLDKYFSGR